MFYWNKTNFDGLKQIAIEYKEDEDLKLFAEYCHYRDTGIRKIAFQKIEEFIKYCESCSLEKQQNISLFLLEIIYRNQEIHTLISDPLKKYLVKIMQFRASSQGESLAYQWLGYLCNNIDMYEKGLKLDPANQICRKALLNSDFNELDWQTHHLNESLFIGTLDHALSTLKHACILLLELSDPNDKKLFEEKYLYYKEIISAWIQYKKSNMTVSFCDWCKENDLKFKPYQTLYYEK